MSQDETRPAFARLEGVLGHKFRDLRLLETALTHKSYVNEHPGLPQGDNERLEFLGDAVLDLVVAHLIMERFPKSREGELSISRAAIVSESGLARAAEEIGLGEWLFLGRGEAQSGGRRKPSILADVFEAVHGAIFLDGGFDAAFGTARRLLGQRILSLDDPGYTDFKTRLQERAQGLYKETPRYVLQAEVGPDHAKMFQVEVILGERTYAIAVGKSKKEAEQSAAEAALFLLEGEDRSQNV